MKNFILISTTLALFWGACQKENPIQPDIQVNQPTPAATNFPETFESGSKGSYTAGTVVLTSGTWYLADALIGTTASDRKNGAKSVRMVNTGTLQMNFNVTTGASIVTVYHAVYGTDGSSTWKLEKSTDNGANWSQVGATITSNSTTLSQVTFAANLYGNCRFRIVKVSGGANRINIDDVQINTNSSTHTREDNMALGNPSGAVNNTAYPDNYLMTKTMYTHAYNRTKGVSNWVSWHLSTAWKGTAPRATSFTTDTDLPSGWYRVTTSDYTNTGFDRGHMCPSEDRDFTTDENKITFKMTNVVPQAPICNQQTWKYLEDYCRTLMNAGNELYIYSGGIGQGGTGANGFANTIASGNVSVPAYVWKVIVVLPVGSDDVQRVSTSTRVIAVKVPNTQTANAQPWGNYRVSVDQLETELTYDFLSNIPSTIQTAIEAAADSGPTS